MIFLFSAKKNSLLDKYRNCAGFKNLQGTFCKIQLFGEFLIIIRY